MQRSANTLGGRDNSSVSSPATRKKKTKENAASVLCRERLARVGLGSLLKKHGRLWNEPASQALQ